MTEFKGRLLAWWDAARRYDGCRQAERCRATCAIRDRPLRPHFVWINNAGVGVTQPVRGRAVAGLFQVRRINLKGVIYGSHVANSAVPRARPGHAGQRRLDRRRSAARVSGGYSATKAGALSLGRALNEALRLTGLGDARSKSRR